MKILFVSQYFYPESFRGNDIAFELAKAGHDVHVVCGTPNYPIGKFFDGYGWLKRRKEVVNGVRVTRLPIIPRGHNAVMLMLNYFSYLICASFYMLVHALFHRYDKVFVQQLSPVMMSYPAIIYKRLRKVELVTWVLDLWPESLRAAGGITNKHVLGFFAYFVRQEYKWSDKILISSRNFEKSIAEYGDYHEKIVYFPQWAEDTIAQSGEKALDVPTLPDGFKIMFAGAVGEAQDFDHVMGAALQTKDDENIKWVIVGDGRKFEWVKEFVKSHGLERTVLLMGRYPVEYMSGFFKQADVMLVCLKDTEIFRLTAPAKIQAYMAVGKPILAMLNGEGAAVVEEARCGYIVPAENAERLAQTVKELASKNEDELQEVGRRGLAYYQEHFEKRKCMEHLFEILSVER